MSLRRTRVARWAVATAQVGALLLTTALPAGAAAGEQTLTQTQLLQVLTHYRIVRGDETGNLRLNSPITRAEMATILVRALGEEKEAETLLDLQLFNDTQGHWARGYIAQARIRNIIKGDPDGNFRPGDEVSNAEALTMILRLVGKEPDAASWPTSAIIMASELGLLPANWSSFDQLKQPAIRGDIFNSLATALTQQKTAEGQTYLQKYVDSTPPTLSVEQSNTTTTASTFTISGVVRDASFLKINGTTVTPSASGLFSSTQSLVSGENVFTIEALDAANNKVTKVLTISKGLPISRLEVTGPSKVAVNGQGVYTIQAYDSNNNAVSAAGVTATVQGNIGTFDVNTGVFKANAQGGTGKIVFNAGPNVTKSVDVTVLGPAAEATRLSIRPVNNGLAVPATREMTVVVEVQNANGTLVENDFGRQVTLFASGVSGLQITPQTATTNAGIATFKVKAATEGTIALTATSGTLSNGLATAEFGTPIQIVLSADTQSLVIGGTTASTRIKAELRDETGNPVVNNSNSDIIITLANQGVGYMADSTLTIRRGHSNSTTSGDDGRMETGADPGTANIRGTLSSTHRYTVVGTAVAVTVPTVGAGTRLEVLSPVNSLTPGSVGTFILRVSDARGNSITSGSYAFQLKVATSNNDPENVTVTLGSTAYDPVSDGIAEGAANDGPDVIARTVGGEARVDVRYTKGGTVTITPILVGGTSKAYSINGEEASALSSTSFEVRSASAVYAKTPAGLTATVDSELGTDQPVGSVANNPSKFYTVRVRVVDDEGNWVPNATNLVSIARTTNNGATTDGSTSKVASGGIAEFRIYASSGAPNFDEYTVSGAGLTPTTVRLYTRNTAPPQAVIGAIRGVKDGIPNATNIVAASDTHMEIDLLPDVSAGWVNAKVYAQNSNTLLYTSPAIDMSGSPQIRVPKNKLPQGITRYQVVLYNGYGNSSERSLVSDEVTNARTLSSIYVNSARYDAVTHKLTVFASGLTVADSWIEPATISIVKNGVAHSLQGAVATIDSSSQFTLDLSGDPALYTPLEDGTFAGNDVKLEAGAGWYTRRNGDAATEDKTNNAVTPLAYISAVTYDSTSRQVTLEGAGFLSGTFSLNKLSIRDASTSYTFLFNSTNASQTPLSKTDTRMVLQLTTTGNSAMQLLANFDGGDVLHVDEGWIQTSATHRAAAQDVLVFSKVSISNVRYNKTDNTLTIYGSGFGSNATSTLDLTQLTLIDRNFPAQAFVLTGATSATVDNDGKITIVLDETTQASKLETASVFDGDNIYLVGQEGWLSDANSRPARGTGETAARLPRPSLWDN